MARRIKRQSSVGEFAKPLIGLLLIGLLYLAYELGLIAVLSEWMVGILQPE